MTKKINYEALNTYDLEELEAELDKRNKELMSLRTTKLRLSKQIPALRMAIYEAQKVENLSDPLEDMLK